MPSRAPQVRLLAAAVAAALPFSSVFAQEEIAAQLAPVIVTATRTAQDADQALAGVTVITREEIERSQAASLPELLRGVPGVDVVTNGGAGKAASLFVRGTDSDHVLILVDGVRIGSATAGGASLQDLPVELIDHIEIVRGPRSGLYGSEAIGGVVQIFTRGAAREGIAPRLSVGLGSQSTRELSAGIGGGIGAGWFDASVAAKETDGFNTCLPSFTAGCYADEPDSDGYRNNSAALRGGWRFDNGAELSANALHVDGRNYFDGSAYGGNRTDFAQAVYGAKLRAPLAAGTTLTAAVGRSQDKQDTYYESAWLARFDTTRDTASLQGDAQLGATLLTLGVDYAQDKVDSSTQYAVDSRDDTGVFVQAQTTLAGQSLQAALRNDDNEQFGSHVTGSLGWGTALAAGLRIYASAGTAFKAPTFNDLYYPGFGNPDLDPEKSKSAELGLKGEPGWGHWSAAVFQNRIDDLIGYDASYVPANIDKARINGLEGAANASFAGFDFGATLTLLDPKNRSAGAYDGKVLPRRSKQIARLDVDRAFGPWRVGATLHAQGHRYDDSANTRRLGGFATLDLRAEYELTRDWRVQARVANAGDKDYQTAYLYPQPGRSVFVTLRYQPAAR